MMTLFNLALKWPPAQEIDMKSTTCLIMTLVCLTLASWSTASDSVRPTAAVLESTQADDWRQPEQDQLLYLEFNGRQVVFELNPNFAPAHIQNLRVLTAQNYFAQTAIIRSQDNYVAQWGDPAESAAQAIDFGEAKTKIEAELYRPRKGLEIDFIDSRDAYAEQVGFNHGFAVGADAADSGRSWMLHCYGALGVGRGMESDSGNASSLYVVTGHSPRHLDRNVTLIGRAIAGIEHLSSLPRGTGPLGFFENSEEYIPVTSLRFGDQLDKDQQLRIELMRTDTDSFTDFVTSRTHRHEDWFLEPTGAIEVCNINVPSREATN